MAKFVIDSLERPTRLFLEESAAGISLVAINDDGEHSSIITIAPNGIIIRHASVVGDFGFRLGEDRRVALVDD